MGIVNTLKNIKQIHEKDIALIRIGKFYYVYGKDAYILSYLLKYKLIQIKPEKIYSCSFPKQSFSKVSALLENKKINYIVLDRRNNYDVEEQSSNKNLNKYDVYFEKAKKYINTKNRIDNIYQYLLLNMDDETIKDSLEKMEAVIYERRKV